MQLCEAVLTVSAEHSAGTACRRCRGGYSALVRALIPTLRIAAVHTVSGLTQAPSSAIAEFPRINDLIRVVALHGTGIRLATSGMECCSLDSCR